MREPQRHSLYLECKQQPFVVLDCLKYSDSKKFGLGSRTMNKIVLMFALITMPFFSHADDWDETESCRVKLKDSFAIEAKYCDDCDTDDIKFYVRGKKTTQ